MEKFLQTESDLLGRSLVNLGWSLTEVLEYFEALETALVSGDLNRDLRFVRVQHTTKPRMRRFAWGGIITQQSFKEVAPRFEKHLGNTEEIREKNRANKLGALVSSAPAPWEEIPFPEPKKKTVRRIK